jgi:hypothetical protein
LLTESQVFEDETLPGTESADHPPQEISEQHDHGKNLIGTNPNSAFGQVTHFAGVRYFGETQHCGALLEVPEDYHWLGSRVDVSFYARAVAVRHVFHQFGDVEALQTPFDRLSNLEEGLTRAYGEENRIVLGPRRLWEDFPCFVSL